MGRRKVEDGASELLLPDPRDRSINSGSERNGARPPAPKGKRLTTFGVDRSFANVLTTAAGYLLVFTAFQTTQMLAASIIGDLGTISIGLIYVCFAFGGFAAPAAARALGPRVGMFLGSLTYVLFVASLIDLVVPITLLCSALIGCGAALLWCSQGILMTQSTNNHNKTKYNSIFWGIFNLCVIPGNLAGHFILLAGDSDNEPTNATTTPAPKHADPFEPMVRGWQGTNSVLFLVLTVIGAFGACVFLLVRPNDPSTGTEPEIESRPVFEQIKATVRCTFQPRMVCLLPIFTFTGVNMTMWASWFTRQMYKTEIGLVMCCFGVAELFGGFTVGRFVEAYGRTPGLILGTVCGVLAMALTYIGSDDFQTYCESHHGNPRPCRGYNNYAPFYIAAVLYGLTDCIIQSVAAAICAKSFAATGNTADAWALFRTFQAGGAAVCFFISPFLVPSGETYSNRDQLLSEIGINSICGIAALFGHWLFTRYHVGTPIDAGDSTPFDRSSRAVVVDRTVYTSAVGGGKRDSKLYGVSSGATSSDEARAACMELKEILESVGSACDKVVKATVYTTPDADVDAVVAVYEEFFAQGSPPHPALSVSMAAQLPWGRRVQIDVVATI